MNHLSESLTLTEKEMGVLRGEVNPKVTQQSLGSAAARNCPFSFLSQVGPQGLFRWTWPISQMGHQGPKRREESCLSLDLWLVLHTDSWSLGCVQWGLKAICVTSTLPATDSLQPCLTVPTSWYVCVCGDRV